MLSPLPPKEEGRAYDVDGDDDVRIPASTKGGVLGLALIPVLPRSTIAAGLLSRLCSLGLGDSP